MSDEQPNEAADTPQPPRFAWTEQRHRRSDGAELIESTITWGDPPPGFSRFRVDVTLAHELPSGRVLRLTGLYAVPGDTVAEAWDRYDATAEQEMPRVIEALEKRARQEAEREGRRIIAPGMSPGSP